MTSEFKFPLKVTAHICANGETWEYRVFLGDNQVGKSVFRTLLVGDRRSEHALVALRMVLGAS